MTRTPVTTRQKLVIWTLALLGASLAIHGWDLATPGLVDRSGRLKGSDYSRLYVTGALADEGRWDVLFDARSHQAMARERVHPQLEMEGLHPNYGPTAAWLLSPFSRLPFLASWLAFSMVSVALYLLAMWVLVETAPALARWRGLVVLGALAAPALFATLRYGQLSAVTTALFAVAAAAARRDRPWLAGLSLGLACYKPHLIVPAALIWLLAREWRLLGGVVIGAAAHVGLGVLVAGPAATVEWMHALSTLARDPGLVQGFPAEVHSLRGFWRLLGVGGLALGAMTMLTSLAAIGMALWTWRKGSPAEGWAALTIATVLVSPHLLTYDLLLLAVAVVLVTEITAGHGEPLRVWSLPAMLCLALYLAPPVSSLAAGATRVQFSTVGMLVLLGWLARTAAARPSGASSSNPTMSS